jgi:hypothetical protein
MSDKLKFGVCVLGRHVNLSVFEEFVCLSSVEVDQGDRLLSAGPVNDVDTELMMGFHRDLQNGDR